MQTYAAYYSINLFSNVLLLAAYAVMVTAEHTACLTKGGTNITDGFEIAFILGLFVQIGDFVNSNVLAILFRFKKQHEEARFGVAASFTQRMNETSLIFEWGYRVMTILVCFL